jgi:hypothetical protein
MADPTRKSEQKINRWSLEDIGVRYPVESEKQKNWKSLAGTIRRRNKKSDRLMPSTRRY